MPHTEKKSRFAWKTIKVFVSSTFRDFHAERDYLVKNVFPELRQWCEQYKLHLVDIDLRWGVSEQETERGEALDICLRGIDESRPFFVCMIGDRYGWIPEQSEINQETFERYELLGHQYNQRLSITHYEIEHAAFNPLKSNQELSRHSFFFLRDNHHLAKISSAKGFLVNRNKEYHDVFFETSKDNYLKLENLKEYILEKCKDNPDKVINYRPEFDNKETNPEDSSFKGRFTNKSLRPFGDKVFQSLNDAIRCEFPERISFLSKQESEQQSVPEQEYHESFIEHRTRLFVGRENVLAKLESYINGSSDKVLVVYGETGCGKSALLASFCRTCKNKSENLKESGILLIPFFIGASPSSTALPSMLRYFCSEIKKAFDIQEDIPTNDDELTGAFYKFLRLSPGQPIFVIDGLNQLDKALFGTNELDWIPSVLPGNAKMIISTLSFDSATKLSSLTNESVKVTPLEENEQIEIIRKLPNVFAKTLDQKLVNTLQQKQDEKLCHPTQNPLYLKVSIEELRVFGSHDKLATFIQYLPADVTDLFVHVLERLSKEYNKQIVERLFCVLECSRSGLNSNELIELMSPLDSSNEYFLILRQVREYLYHRGQLTDIFHQSFSDAIRKKYFTKGRILTGENKRKYHKLLADYFKNKGCQGGNWLEGDYRSVFEVDYHLLKSKRYKELVKLYFDESYLLRVCQYRDDQEESYYSGIFILINKLRYVLASDEELPDQFRKEIGSLLKILLDRTDIISGNPGIILNEIYNYYPVKLAEESIAGAVRLDKGSIDAGFITRRVSTPKVTISGHCCRVTDICVSSDGSRMLTAGKDGSIICWDYQSFNVEWNKKVHKGSALRVCLNSDGSKAISTDEAGNIYFWDVAKGVYETVVEARKKWRFSAFAEFVNDDILLMMDFGILFLWDTKSRMRLLEYKTGVPRLQKSEIAYNNNTIVAFLASQNIVKIYDIKKREVTDEHTFDYNIQQILFNDSGDELYIQTCDQYFYVLNIDTECLSEFKYGLYEIIFHSMSNNALFGISKHVDFEKINLDEKKSIKIENKISSRGYDNVSSIYVNKNNKHVIFGFECGTILITDAEVFAEIHKIEPAFSLCLADIDTTGNMVCGVAGKFNADSQRDGDQAVTIDKTGRVTKLDWLQHTNRVTGISACGRQAVISTDKDGTIVYWKKNKFLKKFQTSYRITCCSSDDENNVTAIGTEEGNVLLVEHTDNPLSLNSLSNLSRHSGWSCITLITDPLRVLTGSFDGVLFFTDDEKIRWGKRPTVHRCTSVAISKNEKISALGDVNGGILIIDNDTEGDNERHDYQESFHNGEITALAFSADGTVLFSAGNDNIIRAICVNRWEVITTTKCEGTVIKLKISKPHILHAVCANGFHFEYELKINTSLLQ